MSEISTTDWHDLLDTWDKQQTRHIRFREERFDIMIQTLGYYYQDRPFTFLDLGCGPGSLTQRILNAFDNASAVAVDTDPVLLEMAKNCLADFGDRVEIVDIDMREPFWTESLPEQNFDAAVSTTAMHWLMPEQLIDAYLAIAPLIAENGLILNGDRLAYHESDRVSRLVSQADKDHIKALAAEGSDGLEWQVWWDQMEQVPALKKAFEIRAEKQDKADAIYGERHKSKLTNLALHELALRHAGFGEVNTIWQRFENRVLMAVKGSVYSG